MKLPITDFLRDLGRAVGYGNEIRLQDVFIVKMEACAQYQEICHKLYIALLGEKIFIGAASIRKSFLFQSLFI